MGILSITDLVVFGPSSSISKVSKVKESSDSHRDRTRNKDNDKSSRDTLSFLKDDLCR